MNTEIYLENQRLDISADISALLTFSIDDVKDFSARSTTWSKTIVLPGTANNNKLFGHIFQIGQSNEYSAVLDNIGYNFNASKSAFCIIFQDNIQTFKGVLRLLQINIEAGRVEYEVSVFGELAGLNSALSGGLLEDLDFSAYDHIYDEDAITDSWDNTPGSGVYYPLIDYGTYSTELYSNFKHHWDIRTFRPAIYVKEIIDKSFEAANFRYQSDLFDTARFKGLVIPNTQKALYNDNKVLVLASGPDPSFYSDADGDGTFALGYFSTDINADWTIYPNTEIQYFQYNGTNPIKLNLKIEISGTYHSNKNYLFFFDHHLIGGGIATVPGTTLVPTPSTTLVPFSQTGTGSIVINPGEFVGIRSGVDTYVGGLVYDINLSSAIFTISADSTESVTLNPGEEVNINYNLPKNIRQIDFFVSIIKLFNLYAYEDRFDKRLIYITPYVDFYSTDSSDAVDWTYKLNRDKVIKVKPMSEVNAKIYDFKYKPDSDFYNDLYKKRYGQDYGNYIFDSMFEFADQRKSFELIFSSTPLVGFSGEEKIYPTIFKRSGEVEETIDSNIRILQTKKITGVASWDIKDGATVLKSVTSYGYAGHFDDPDAPSNDLNFGALRELFFTLLTGDLSNTQFNIYWSSYMAEITDKDSKLVTASFYLKPSDIFNLDFSKYVQLDGVLFRINKISDYNMSNPSDCQVELLKVNYTKY